MTQWIYRCALIVEAADRDAANSLATKIFQLLGLS
jgi:hypothetical protein